MNRCLVWEGAFICVCAQKCVGSVSMCDDMFVNTFAYAAPLVFAAQVILHSHLYVETLFFLFKIALIRL